MIDIVVTEELIKTMYKSIKRDNPGIDDKEVKEYIRTSLLMMYKNKEEIKMHAHKKTEEERKHFDGKHQVYGIYLRKSNELKPIWMMYK